MASGFEFRQSSPIGAAGLRVALDRATPDQAQRLEQCSCHGVVADGAGLEIPNALSRKAHWLRLVEGQSAASWEKGTMLASPVSTLEANGKLAEDYLNKKMASVLEADGLVVNCGLSGSRQQITAHKQSRIPVPSSELLSWSFSAFEFDKVTNGRPLFNMTMALLEHYELLDGWKVNRKTMEAFLTTVEDEYLPNAYHNAIHATDVTQTSVIIMESYRKQVSLSKEDIFCIVVASAVHDLGHLGVNNDFLINSRHPRATTYNDRSVNESFHISRAFEIARTVRGCDIFEQFTFDEQKKCRKLMVDMVLATDMAIHFDLLKRFSDQIEKSPVLSSWQDISLQLQMLLHLADIANPSRPFHLAKGWAERVISEFCEQGDKEAAGGLPISPFCVRANMDMPKAQQNFIEIFLRPTLQAFKDAAPEFVNMALKCLDVTVASWKDLQEQGFKM